MWPRPSDDDVPERVQVPDVRQAHDDVPSVAEVRHELPQQRPRILYVLQHVGAGDAVESSAGKLPSDGRPLVEIAYDDVVELSACDLCQGRVVLDPRDNTGLAGLE